MRISTRNQFKGQATVLRIGPVNADVSVDIGGGDKIDALVTTQSLENLGIRDGVEVYALVKASSVMLVGDSAGMHFSARNQLTGKVEAVTTGAVNSEVLVRLPGGAMVVAIITNASASGMALRQGDDVTAMFKASSVFLATQS